MILQRDIKNENKRRNTVQDVIKSLFAEAWCQNCDVNNLCKNFCNWTSGNSKIDEFIQHTQINAKENLDYLEWIEFDQFDLIKFTHLAQFLPLYGLKVQSGILTKLLECGHVVDLLMLF